MAGFAVFMLAPSLGLPPELPGMPAAELGPRQVWWLLTAAATAAGLALLAFRRTPVWAVGGRRPAGGAASRGRAAAGRARETLVPETLAAQFRRRRHRHQLPVLGALGVLSAVFFQRFGRPTASCRPPPEPALPFGA